MESSLSERIRRAGRRVGGQFDIAGEVHLHPVAFTDGDGREPVEESIHHLERCLRRRIADSASDHDRSISIAAAKARASQVLREPADEANSSCRSKRREVVLIYLVPKTGVADLVESQELIEAVVRPSGINRRWKDTASRVSPNV